MIVDTAVVKSWNEAEGISGPREAELARCIQAAGDLIQETTSRVIEQQALTLRFDGWRADGLYRNELWLPKGHRPVAHLDPDFVTVVENGATLSVGEGIESNADVLIVNANVDSPCRLVKPYAPWFWGYQNILVTYKAGWPTAQIPTWVQQLVAEVALLMFRDPKWLGQASQSRAGAAVTWMTDLSQRGRWALNNLAVS